MNRLLNLTLANNRCFGCGHDNPDGLHIHVWRDPDVADRLLGQWEPRSTHTGFPEIAHGGLQFTALDCMAGWAMFTLRAPPNCLPLTVKATVRYARAALGGAPLRLTAEIAREAAGPKDPVAIRTAVLGADGAPLTEAEFEYVAVPADKFVKLVGLTELPEHHRAWVANPDRGR